MNSVDSFKDFTKVHSALHAPARIAVMLFLLSQRRAKFSLIQKALGLTAGNLSSHLKKLSQSGFIDVEKMFVDEKPVTILHITSIGQREILSYTSLLNSALTPTD
ncbi:MAG: transcriptional regulator [Candidatus Kariarchaeaceae archaeon]